MNNKKIDVFFDFVSPFAYLLHQQLHQLPNDTEVKFVPVLFAGLLKHWGSLGPVEIEKKRIFTYRHTSWLGKKLGIPFRTPDTHPFNPLPYLRLSIALGNHKSAIDEIFRAIWVDGLDPTSEESWQAICSRLNVNDASTRISQPEVKDKLRLNTESAIEAGVFGVPTMRCNGELFWGLDSLELLVEYLHQPDIFNNSDMLRLQNIKDGAKKSGT